MVKAGEKCLLTGKLYPVKHLFNESMVTGKLKPKKAKVWFEQPNRWFG